MLKLMRLLRAIWSFVWDWASLMSGALLVVPSLYNVYQVGQGRPPISANLTWAIVQLGAAIAIVVVATTKQVAAQKQAVTAEQRAAAAEAKLADRGAATRARNAILAGLA